MNLLQLFVLASSGCLVLQVGLSLFLNTEAARLNWLAITLLALLQGAAVTLAEARLRAGSTQPEFAKARTHSNWPRFARRLILRMAVACQGRVQQERPLHKSAIAGMLAGK